LGNNSEIQNENTIAHISTHDKFMEGRILEEIDSSIDNNQNNGTMPWRKMRTLFDWRLAEKTVKESWPDVLPKLNYMKNIMGTVNDYFHKRFQVMSEDKMSLSGLPSCHGYKIPDDLRTNPINQDLVVNIIPYNQNTGWFAAAGACALDSKTKRPIAGVILLNFKHIKIAEENYYSTPIVFMHELMHIMGFSSYFFDYYKLASQVQIAGKSRYAITAPNVVEHAKKYFGCDQVKGVPLENGGGSGSKGSHWEKQLMPNEIMNPMVARPATISEFTIKVFEAMGFYKGVNAAQRYTYNKGTGCEEVVQMKCKAEMDGEYCRAEDMGHDHCYTNKLGKASCAKNYFTETCGFKSPLQGALCTMPTQNNNKNFTFEDYGAHSRCAMLQKNGNNWDAACLRIRCTSDNVEVKIGDEVFTCPSKGRHQVALKIYSGSIECPSYDEMCTQVFEHRCSMDCYGKGYCMGDRTCQCLHGFLGPNCNDGGQKETDPFVTEYE